MITVLNPDNGQYILNFQDPSTLKYTASSAVKANADANTFKNAVERPYCLRKLGSWCSVSLEMFDAAGNVTTTAADSVKNVYTMKISRLRGSVGSNKVIAAKTTTTSQITVETPSTAGQSSPPLSGKFKIKCIDADGFESFTEDMAYDRHALNINLNIMNQCSMMYDRSTGYESYTHGWKQNGIDVFIRFSGLNENPGQFELISSEADPLSGDNVTISSTTVQEYSTNLFYQPIPYEFLHTYETKPQLIVTVNNEMAVCHNLTCDF